jgi:soluble lytic murein transglycosylase-like protein
MLTRFFKSTSAFAQRKVSQSTAWAVIARDTVSGFITTAHHTLMVLGLIAIGALGTMFVKPDIADQLIALSPFAEATAAESDDEPNELSNLVDSESPQQQTGLNVAASPSNEDGKLIGNARQQKWITNWLSKRYRVALDATDMLVSAAYLTAKEIKLDPLLILSVMAIESGLNPFAESPVGAQGLMQVMSKVHHDKFEDLGGVKAALNPVANIKVGSLILKDYVTRGGSVEAGLKLYVGAGTTNSDSGYGAKVLAEYQRLKEVSMGKKVPVFTSSATSAPQKSKLQESKVDTSGESTSIGKHDKSALKSDQVAGL